jgi:hypothetical protein
MIPSHDALGAFVIPGRSIFRRDGCADTESMTEAETEKGKKEKFLEEWANPWWSLAEIANLWLRDAIGALIVVGVMEALDLAFQHMGPEEWSIQLPSGELRLTASQIVHWGDLFVLLMFIGKGLFETYVWMRKK